MEPVQEQKKKMLLTQATVIDQPEENLTITPSCTERKLTKKVFFNIPIDGEPAGRITIGLYGVMSPQQLIGLVRLLVELLVLATEEKSLSKSCPTMYNMLGLDPTVWMLNLQRGRSNLGAETLIQEWERTFERCPRTKNVAGSVRIIVRDPAKPPPKLKLVARKGKLEIDQEEVGTDPNRTEFVIATKESPELDASTLVIGRVITGMEVVQRVGQVKTMQENRVAKLIGDMGAVEA